MLIQKTLYVQNNMFRNKVNRKKRQPAHANTQN